MVLGSCGAGGFGYHYGAWAGVLGALALGAVGGLVHAVATVVFGVDHIISGVAINIIALGAVTYLAAATFTGTPGGGSKQSPHPARRPVHHHRAAQRRPEGGRGRGLVLRLRAGRAGPRAVHQPLAAGRARPAPGRQLRPALAHGLRPPAALVRREPGGGGVPRRQRAAAKVHRGHRVRLRSPGWRAASWPCAASWTFRDGQTGGRGCIGLVGDDLRQLAPRLGCSMGSGLFGYTEKLGLRQGGTSVHALLLAVAALALAVGLGMVVAARCAPASSACGGRRGRRRVPRHRPGAGRVHDDDALRDHAAGAGLRLPAVADAGADGQIYRRGSAG